MIIGGFQKFSMIDYPEKLAAIVFTKGCNFKCPYCHNPELNDIGTTEDLINENDILEFLKTRQAKLDAVVISGGEPTLQKNLISFAKKIKDLGFLLKLDTNGTKPDIIEKLIQENLLDYIAMDIKTTHENYYLFTKNELNIKYITSSINLIINSNVNYEFRTTIIKSLLHFEDFKKIGIMLDGAEKYYLQKFVPTKTLDKTYLSAQTYTKNEFEIIKNILTPYIKNIYLR